MTVEVRQAISLISQRIVLAPAQVEAPSPFGRGTIEKRFREGLITEAQFRQEMQSLGYIGATIDRSLAIAKLEHEFDNFQDLLTAVETAYDKDIFTPAEAKHHVLMLVPDQGKALLLFNLMDWKKRPKPKALTPEEPPTLTVAKLLSAFSAGVLGEAQLRAELATRLYSPADIELLIATEIAHLPKPTAAQVKKLTLAELKAALAMGLMSPAEFTAELIRRKYSQSDAQLLLGMEMIKISERPVVPPPTLTVSQLLSSFIAGTLSEPLLRSEMTERGYSEEDIVLLVSTAGARLPKPTVVERTLLTLAQLNALLAVGIITTDEFVAELLARNYSEEDAARLLGLEMIKINARAA
jgi:hypothetical protein